MRSPMARPNEMAPTLNAIRVARDFGWISVIMVIRLTRVNSKLIKNKNNPISAPVVVFPIAGSSMAARLLMINPMATARGFPILSTKRETNPSAINSDAPITIAARISKAISNPSESLKKLRNLNNPSNPCGPNHDLRESSNQTPKMRLIISFEVLANRPIPNAKIAGGEWNIVPKLRNMDEVPFLTCFSEGIPAIRLKKPIKPSNANNLNGEIQPFLAIKYPADGTPRMKARDHPNSVIAINCPRWLYWMRSPRYACIPGSNTYFPMVEMMRDMTKNGKVGKNTTRAVPAENKPMPSSIPNLRLRRSDTDGTKGPRLLTADRAVRASDIL